MKFKASPSPIYNALTAFDTFMIVSIIVYMFINPAALWLYCIALVVLIAVDSLILIPSLFKTEYTIGKNNVLLQCGLQKCTIPLSGISEVAFVKKDEKIRGGNYSINAPSVKIVYISDGDKKTAAIAPKDKKQFVDALNGKLYELHNN